MVIPAKPNMPPLKSKESLSRSLRHIDGFVLQNRLSPKTTLPAYSSESLHSARSRSVMAVHASRNCPLLRRNSTSSVTKEKRLSIHPRRLPELWSAAIASQPRQMAILILTENQSTQAKKQDAHTSSMAIACQSASQPAEMHQLPAQLPSLPRSPSPH
jgi:hypothetical protein